MDVDLNRVVIKNPDDLSEVGVDWTLDPVFEFDTEVDALMTLEILGDDLRAAREQVRHIMRYMTAAVRAARYNGEGEAQPQAIISYSGVARQTVYNMLSEGK